MVLCDLLLFGIVTLEVLQTVNRKSLTSAHMKITRSVQRLVLIMPVEEILSSPVVVKDYEHSVECRVQL